jgi:hypothetical protein
MRTANNGAIEKLVTRLLGGSDDIFTEFVVVGLEDSLETICNEVERLLKIENLSPIQQTDLNELCQDGKATIRVLQYYTHNYYYDQGRLMGKAEDKLMEYVF